MDAHTRRKIDEVVWATLREAGLTKPPVSAEALLEHLNLHRHYYDLQDPSFLDKVKHKVRIHGTKLATIIKKVCLTAVLFHDENRVVVDASLPPRRREWPTMHEAAHRILVWHRPYFAYGDTAQTLDPQWHERLELEANYGASALSFCGPVFEKEALDTTPQWVAIEGLRVRYAKSYTMTLRRYVQHGPHLPMAMVGWRAWWVPPPADESGRCRHFVTSSRFAEEFPEVGSAELIAILDPLCHRARGGLVADSVLSLRDQDGKRHEFRVEAFFNSHYLLALIAWRRKMDKTTISLAG